MKLLALLVLAVLAWRLLIGRWPGFAGPGAATARLVADARGLLEVRRHADRAEIIAAHRRLLTRVHPDHGGSGEAVQAADAARDLLLGELARRTPNRG
ncbi:MAG: J domain-containing protein [Novosphingobium sp.]